MLHKWIVGGELFALLTEWDAQIAAAVSAAGCPHCGGPLYQSNYRRKPRGGAVAPDGEAFSLRHSLCCGREGCRKRALPPSLRFLGRRVYLEIVVVLGSAWALIAGAAAAADDSGVPRQTLSRWGQWWRSVFPQSETWTDLRARFAPPPPSEADLPASLVARLDRDTRADHDGAADRTSAAIMLARCIAPATTISVENGARFLRDAAGRMQAKLLAQNM